MINVVVVCGVIIAFSLIELNVECYILNLKYTTLSLWYVYLYTYTYQQNKYNYKAVT